jgi:hypothetical protein
VGKEPQRPGRRQGHPQRVGTEDALPLAALVLPESGKGVTVTDRNFSVPLRRPLYTQVMRRLLR